MKYLEYIDHRTDEHLAKLVYFRDGQIAHENRQHGRFPVLLLHRPCFCLVI
ncbi:hypothetical protein DPMN_165151 [Dreissena polymorpha]|uniref:Uncharacterized protein n=1 Tax=Dreissena polymorpha TaxID=45954 RepID=A0A9D4EVJ5_DREPO|nr:hypothetical protein DPMN_165151 [Dreissena polymorpha]